MAITGASARFSAGFRILTSCRHTSGDSLSSDEDDSVTVSSSDSVFGFLEASINSPASDGVQEEIDFCDEDEHDVDNDDIDDEDDEGAENSQGKKMKNFWKNQRNLLQATLCRTTALETGIRNVTREAVKEIREEERYCKCGKAVGGSECRMCLMREIFSRLRIAGYSAAVCRSNWRSSPDIPSGQHTYIDVIDNSCPEKGEVRVIVELNFRAEFEMARANQDYNDLVARLPEIFVCKVERLRALVKILCSAGKKCLKAKKMHIAPWRKHKYMQAKWFTPCKRWETEADVDFLLSKKAMKPLSASRLTMVLRDVDVPLKAVSVM